MDGALPAVATSTEIWFPVLCRTKLLNDVRIISTFLPLIITELSLLDSSICFKKFNSQNILTQGVVSVSSLVSLVATFSKYNKKQDPQQLLRLEALAPSLCHSIKDARGP